MPPRHFMMTIMATVTLFHLLRFPHLILENGGGAFLLLFLIVLNGAIFPILITERVLDNKLKLIDIKNLMWIKKGGKDLGWDRSFVFFWYALRSCVLLAFLWFFLYLSGTAVLYFNFFIRYLLDFSRQSSELSTMPQLDLGLLGGMIWSVLVFLTYRYKPKDFFSFFNQWVLPGCFLILLFLFFKIILSLQNFEALKVLLYPDFSALTPRAFLDSIGHGLVCLFVGVGLYRHLQIDESKLDIISLFVNLTISALVMALVIGVMALPLIHQVSELPFGSSWIFSILPRWLSYTEFGAYYCALFFLGIIIICFYFSVLLIDLISQNSKMIYKASKPSNFFKVLSLAFVLSNGLMIHFLQRNLQGWSGQSLLLDLDFILINIGLPLLAIMTVWFVFRHTSSIERSDVFSHQQIFFHSRYFFKAWEWLTLFIVPLAIGIAFLLVAFL